MESPTKELICQTCGGALTSGPLGLRCARCVLSMAEEAESGEDEYVGELFPELRLECQVAKGGFGTVYRAEHRRMRRPVALKFLDRILARNPEAVALFQQEMVSVGGLDHPGIVRAHDAGERDGHWYIIMEFVDGMDCGALVRKHGTLPVTESCEIIRQAAAALHWAHGKGLVHRDVKPGNVMVSRGGDGAVRASVKVLDFGLAGLAMAPVFSRPATEGGSTLFLGTLEYISPEQIEDPATVDARADIYSLGATLWRLLTGRTPHGGGSPDTSLLVQMQRITSEPVPSLATVRPGLPGPLVQLCDAMLSLDRAKRPASAAEVARLLEPWCAGADLTRLFRDGPLDERPPSFFSQLRWVARRHRAAAALVLAGAAILVTATIAGFLLARQARLSEAAMSVARDRARLAEAAAGRARGRAERESYQAAVQLARLHIEEGEPWLASDRLHGTLPALRGWEWGHLMAAIPRPEAAAETGISVASQLAASRDGAVAFAWYGSGGALVPMDGGAPRRLEMPGPIAAAALSHDGSRLALVFEPGTLRVLRRDGSTAWEVPFAAGGAGVAWEPGESGALLAVNGNSAEAPGDFQRFDRETGTVLFAMKLPRKQIIGEGLVVGSQGRMAAIRTSYLEVAAVELPSCQVIRNVRIGDNTLISEFLADDVRNRLVLCSAGYVVEVSLPDGVLNHIRPPATPADVPNFRRVSVDETGRVLALTDRAECTGDGPLEVRPVQPARAVAPVAGSRHIALLAGGRLERRTDARSAAVRGLPARPFQAGSEARNVAWSPDSRLVAVEPWDRGCILAGPPDGTELTSFPTGNTGRSTEWSRMAVWHPDGSLITHFNNRPVVLRRSAEAPGQPGKWPVGQLPLAGPVWSATMLDNGSRLACATPGGVAFIDWKTLAVLREVPLTGARFYLFTHADDATVFALGSDSRLHRLGAEPVTENLGPEIREIRGTAPPAAFAPAGSILAVGATSGTRIYRLAASGPPVVMIRTFPPDSRITAVAFSPDGRRLVTAGSRRTLIVWDWEESLPLLELPVRARCSSAAFSADGRWLAIADFGPSLECREAVPWAPLPEPRRP